MKITQQLESFWKVFRFSSVSKAVLIWSIIAILCESINVQILAIGRKWVVDSSLSGNFSNFMFGVAAILMFAVSGSSSIIVIDYQIYKKVRLCGYEFKERLMRSLLFTKGKSLEQEASNSDIPYRSEEDIEILSNLYGELYLMVASFGRAVGAIIVGYFLSPILSLIVMTLSMMNLFLQKHYLIQLSDLASGIRKKEEAYLGQLIEFIENHHYVKLMASKFLLSQARGHNRSQYVNNNREEGKINASIFTLNSGVNILVTLVMISVGVMLVINKMMTLGDLVAFIGIQGALMDPYRYFSDFLKGYSRIYPSYKRLSELIVEEGENGSLLSYLVAGVDSKTATEETAGKLGLEIRELHFGYVPDKLILKNFSTTLSSGGLNYIIGSSGCGKTTLVKLIIGLETASKGSILLNQNGIKRTIELKDLTYVSQYPFIFNGTIYENIALKRSKDSIESVVEIAKKVNLHEFIMGLPDQYDTVLCDKGKNLSGGEAVRVSLARALLRETRLMVFDEIFAALDQANAKSLTEMIRNNIRHDNLTILITHRHELIGEGDYTLKLS